ncbi:uncharacterized protein EV422DRAFT_220609 [Fimicolochytrium jonesii]|uniref:uncharacterized protein n=1 Tax=Fimicolochytrium jonesii TaxID=1396493 RepID=UPI0022FEF8BA|nr:uncharacterized protein EV422DRAFT_220609 [Fimicolochytrium jonesii]KAI8817610.1 hypothetical protein EV422DRAFT_220609 [Fimicolochytrium jonesii]
MDDVLKWCVEEIALEGAEAEAKKDLKAEPAEGILEIVRTLPGKLDKHLQSYLWSLVIRLNDIQALAVDDERIGNLSTDVKRKKDNRKDPAQDKLKSGGNEIPHELSYTDAVGRYGARIRLVAKETVRRTTILLGIDSNTIRLSQTVWDTLAIIAQSRAIGKTQAELAKALDLDPRSMFYYVKGLLAAKLIVKYPVVINGAFTNNCVLKRYAVRNEAYLEFKKDHLRKSKGTSDEDFSALTESDFTFASSMALQPTGTQGKTYYTDLLKHRVTQILKNARNQVMVQSDLMDALKIGANNDRSARKWFNRTIDALVRTGFLTRVLVPRLRSGVDVGNGDRCVKLVNIFVPRPIETGSPLTKQAKTSYRVKQLAGDADKEMVLGEGGVLADLPLEWQVYRLIALSGERGTTSGIIQRSLNNLGERILDKILNKIVKPLTAPPEVIGAIRVAEFAGRERRYRYFSPGAYHRMQQSEHAGEYGDFEHIATSGPSTPSITPVKNLKTAKSSRARTAPKEIKPPRKKRKVYHTSESEAEFSQADTSEDAMSIVLPNNDDDVDSDENIVLNSSQQSQVDDAICKVCNRDEDEDKLLLCDGCDQGVHLYCLDPPLDEVPEDDYFCSERCRETKLGKPGVPKRITRSQVAARPQPVVSVEAPPVEMVPETTEFASRPDHAESETPLAIPIPHDPGPAQRTPKRRHVPTITYVRRQNLLSKLLQEKKILEVGRLLLEAYHNFSMKDGQSNLHKVDLKTLRRTAVTMEADNLLKICTVSFPQISGKNVTKTLLLDKSLKVDDFEVEQYIEMMRDRQAVLPPGVPLAKGQVEHLEVERLSDIRKRLGAPLTSTATNVDSGSEKEDSEAPQRTAGSKALRNAYAEQPPLYFAQQCGYVNASILRARILHEWLAEHMLDKKDASHRTPVSISAGPFRNSGVFPASMFTRDLPFDVYLKIVGHQQPSQAFADFMHKTNHSDIRMADLPLALRKEIFGPSLARFRRLINQSVDILLALQLLFPNSGATNMTPNVEANEAKAQNQLRTAYYLPSVLPLYDYMSDPERLLRTYTVRSFSDIQMFWLNLEHDCLRGLDDKRAVPMSDTEGEARSESKTAPTYLYAGGQQLAMLNIKSNWTATFPYTEAQLKVLGSHVDTKAFTTPLRNDPLCKRLSEETGLALARVKYYYHRAEDKFQKKQQAREKSASTRRQNALLKRQKATERQRLAPTPSQNEVTAEDHMTRSQRAGLRVKQTIESQREGRLVGRRTYRAGTGNAAAAGKGPAAAAASSLEDVNHETVPVIVDEERYQTQYRQIAKRVRAIWSHEDDELLLHAYAMLREHADARFHWDRLAPLFQGFGYDPDDRRKIRNNCRRRIAVLYRTAESRISSLLAQWPNIRRKGIDEGVFTQAEFDEAHPASLEKMANYFMRNNVSVFEEVVEPGALVHLPKTPDALEALFELKDLSNVKPHPEDLEEDVDERPTQRSKMSALYARSLTLQAEKESHLTHPRNVPNIGYLEESVARAVIKMILLTPEASYQSSHAFWILQAFNSDVIETAVRKLNATQTIVKVKGSTDRRVPGRGYVLSDKFLSSITGVLPDRILPQALAFRSSLLEQLKDSPSCIFEPFTNSGSMMVLLEATSCRIVRLQPKFLEKNISFNRVMDVHEDPAKGHFDVRIIRTPMLETSSAVASERANGASDANQAVIETKLPYGPHGTLSDGATLNAIALETEDDRPWLEKVYQIVKEAGDIAISLTDLEHKFTNWGGALPCLRRCLASFEASSQGTGEPPVIVKVGFDDVRYVLREYVNRWQIPVYPERTDTDTNVDIQPTTFVPARMWYDIHGNAVNAVKRACLEVVLGIMVKKPGIYESKIFERVESLMTRMDLMEVLDILVQRGACSRQTIVKAPPITNVFDALFGSSGVETSPCIIEGDDESFSDRKINCYWPLPHWYMKTS